MILFSAGAALATPCWAETQAENIAAARALGIEGIRLADEGRCADAVDKLERALALHHAPTMLGRLGECQVQLGRIVLGTENLNRVVREPLAPNAPAAFVRAQERARAVLQTAVPRIAHVVVHVRPAVARPSVTISGVPIPAALIGAERPTDPGTYEIVVRARGYVTTKSQVTLTDGAREELTLTLAPDATRRSPATALAPPPQAGNDKTLAYALLGAGAAGLATGAVAGVLALSKEGGLECPANDCPPSEHGALDGANRLATISTVGFGVGILGAAAGVVLLLVDGERAQAPHGVVTPRPFVGLHGAGVAGRF